MMVMEHKLPPWLAVRTAGSLREWLAAMLLEWACRVEGGTVSFLCMRVAWKQGWRPVCDPVTDLEAH